MGKDQKDNARTVSNIISLERSDLRHNVYLIPTVKEDMLG